MLSVQLCSNRHLIAQLSSLSVMTVIVAANDVKADFITSVVYFDSSKGVPRWINIYRVLQTRYETDENITCSFRKKKANSFLSSSLPLCSFHRWNGDSFIDFSFEWNFLFLQFWHVMLACVNDFINLKDADFKPRVAESQRDDLCVGAAVSCVPIQSQMAEINWKFFQ